MSDAFEMAVEVALVGKAAERGGFGNRHSFGEFGFSAGDAQLDEIFVRRKPDVLFESPADMNAADLRQFDERIERKRIRKVGVQKIFDAGDESRR